MTAQHAEAVVMIATVTVDNRHQVNIAYFMLDQEVADDDGAFLHTSRPVF